VGRTSTRASGPSARASSWSDRRALATRTRGKVGLGAFDQIGIREQIDAGQRQDARGGAGQLEVATTLSPVQLVIDEEVGRVLIRRIDRSI
jgi:hypothetical protein